MWGIYECCNNFFRMHLSQQDLSQGVHLQNPLMAYSYDMVCWQEITWAGVPASLGYSAPISETLLEEAKTLAKVNARCSSKKKRKFWKRKRATTKACFDNSLKKLKQNIIQANGQTNLGQLLCTNNTTIPAALKTLGFAQTFCGQWTLWGSCSDPKCALTHLEKALPQTQILKVASLLLDSAAKLAVKRCKLDCMALKLFQGHWLLGLPQAPMINTHPNEWQLLPAIWNKLNSQKPNNSKTLL